jgi:hypothetical protein
MTGAYVCMDEEPISPSLGGGAWLGLIAVKDNRLTRPCVPGSAKLGI